MVCCNYKINSRTGTCLREKKNMLVWRIRGHVGGLCTIWVARATPLGVHKCPYNVLLEASSCSLHISAILQCVYLVVVRFVASGPYLYFLFFSLSFPENYSLTLLIINISNSVLIFYIFNFLSNPFIKVKFVFNFIIET